METIILLLVQFVVVESIILSSPPVVFSFQLHKYYGLYIALRAFLKGLLFTILKNLELFAMFVKILDHECKSASENVEIF